MNFCKSRLPVILALLVAGAVCVPSIQGEEGPFLGLWDYAPRGSVAEDLFLYRSVLRYRARAVLRSGGMLPPAFRSVEDSLGLNSTHLNEFVSLQESRGLGWIPPTTLPSRGKDFRARQVSVLFDNSTVEDGWTYHGTPVHPVARTSVEDYLGNLTRRNYRTLWSREADRSLQLVDPRAQQAGGLLPELELPVEMPGAIRSIVGAGKPNLQVTGSERISFSGTSRWYPDRPETEFQRRQSKFPQLDMKQELNLKLTGNIGDKVSVDVDQSSQASTPLANRIKIHYDGYDDEILQRVELGNTSLSLPGTQYVSYSGRHEGLFGIHAQALVGDVEVSGILSKQEGKNETKAITRGAELQEKTIDDWQYRAGKFFFLVDPDGPRMEGQSALDVASLEVWVDDRNGANDNEQLTIPAYVTMSGEVRDPPQSPPRSQRATGAFNQLVANEDYIVQTDVYLGYPVVILSDRNILDGRMTKAMAVRYRTTGGTSVGGFIGSQPDTLVLKLIRPASEMGGTNPLDLTQGIFAATRRLELRNIYDLGSNLAQEGLLVRIERKKTVGGATNPDRIGDHTFLSILGLDLFTSAGEGRETPGPDGKIDQGRIDYETGYVMFRELQPFAPTPLDIRDRFVDSRPDTLDGAYIVPNLYLRNDWSAGNEPDLVSQYRFVVTARSVATRITLGFNLIHGSETVTSGGRALVRDRDYTIDYDTGEIQILDSADVRDTDEIRVSYSYLPFGGGGQKTLLGTAIRLRPQNTKLGLSTTWIYESKGSPGVEGRRPRLGQEPTRTIVGELATTYRTDSWALTSLVDALPGYETRQKSNFTFDAGIGMSLPNPNTRGQLYIDDFEGAKDEQIVSMNRLGWRPSGVPVHASGNDLGDRVRRRGESWWYSPRTAVREGDLQPTDERSGGLADTEKDNNRQILELHFFPNGTTPEERRHSWFSLVQPLSTRGTDLSRAQFLDIWVNDFLPLSRLNEREGRIHIDIGVVSENAIWRRVRPEALGPDSFEPGRDLDFALNTEDKNRDGQLDNPGGGRGEDVGIDGLTDAEEGTGADPGFDNWEFVDTDESRDRLEPKDDPARSQRYAKINGTQGNGRLDTEDLNGNLILDEVEGYFRFVLDLADTSRVEFESSQAPDQDSKYAPYTRGWRRYRIPLATADSSIVGAPTWEQVRHIRFWVDGFSKETYVQIGGIEITGNRWLRGAIRDSLGAVVPDSTLRMLGEDFFPGVLNNKDNSTSEYLPPFQPRERQGVEEREQSLTLEMRNFSVGHSGSVFRTYSQPQDFSNLYEKLEFYLNRRIREGPSPELEFFVRFARDAVTDTTNYYEYRVTVPDAWTLMTIDLAEVASLQLIPGCRPDSCLSSIVLRDGALILRKGNPNLTSVRRIAFGVRNRGPTAVVSGNIWVNELRLTGVKKDTGIASRMAIGVNLADLASLGVNFSRVDADFLRIGSEVGSGRTRTNLGLNGRMNVDRFLTGTGLNIPLTYTASASRDVPKFRTGSDLVLEKPTNRDIAESYQEDLSLSVSRNPSRNRWIRNTIDKVSVSGRVGRSESNTPLSRTETETRSGNVQYTLPMAGGPPLRVYRKTELRLLPTTIGVGLSGSQTATREFGRRNGDLYADFVRIPREAQKSTTLNWSSGLRPLEQINYSFDQTRDLRLDTNRREILGLNIGTESGRRHRLSANHQVTLLPGSLNLVPRASWTSGFEGAFNTILTGASGSRQRTNRISNSSTLTFGGALPIDRIYRMLRPAGRGGEAQVVEEAPEDTTGEGRPRRRAPTPGTRQPFFSIGAISATYTIGKTNRIDRVSGEPSIGYQLGWARDPGHGVTRQPGAATSSGDRTDLNLSTDMKILSEVQIRTTFATGTNKNSVNGAESTTETLRFPDLSINWGRLHQKIGLDKYARDLRASSNYSRTDTETRSGTSGDNRRNEVRVAMNPLLNIDARLVKDLAVRLSTRYDATRSEQATASFLNVSNSIRRQLGLTLSRSISLNRMVTNPISKKRSRVTSKLDLSVTGNYGDEIRETRQGPNAVVGYDHVRFDLSTTAGYNFTSNISGNAGISFGQDTDRKNRTNTVRSVSVTLTAAFRF